MANLTVGEKQESGSKISVYANRDTKPGLNESLERISDKSATSGKGKLSTLFNSINNKIKTKLGASP